jgi:hypothetical protein
MDEHDFDGVALVFGLLFAAAGLIVLFGGELVDQGKFLIPIGLLGLGVALFGSSRAGEYRPSDEIGAERGEDR